MFKKLLIVVVATLLLSMTLLLGCSALSGSSNSTSSHKILRQAEIAAAWQMYQLEITIPAGSELPILLTLASDDKVDGYYYLEKGNTLDFEITANSLIDQVKGDSGKATSSRFSFNASDVEGKAYILTLRNVASKGGKEAEVTAFLEVIYPLSGSIFVPLEEK